MSTTAIVRPQILNTSLATRELPLDQRELEYVRRASNLYNGGFHEHALLDLWNASIHNLRRRVELYGVDLFTSVVKDVPGRKTYDANGEDEPARWRGVEDIVLLEGCRRLGLIGRKGAKVLEMVDWMRNHASPAHNSPDEVAEQDVRTIAEMLEVNLFKQPLPEAGHSVGDLFKPVKEHPLDPDQIQTLCDQVKTFRAQDVRTCFGFLVDVVSSGAEPGTSNAVKLLPTAWEAAGEEVRRLAGLRYHEALMARDAAACTRLVEQFVRLEGVKYIPDGARARLYRSAAEELARAKDKPYGWRDEEAAAKTLAQYGPHVPSIAFEEVYQEVLSVWCGNYWGRSDAHSTLTPFIDTLDSARLLRVAGFFRDNERVRAELFQTKPRAQAEALLLHVKGKLTLAQHRQAVDDAIAELPR